MDVRQPRRVIDSPVWARPFLRDDHHGFTVALLDEADAFLLGRKTYQGFLDFWPRQTGEIADRLNSRPKYVASRTLPPGAADWNATILEGDVAEGVTRLKAEAGGNIVKFGTGELDRTLLEHRLVDEYYFSKAPVVVGQGERLFEGVEAAGCGRAAVRAPDRGLVHEHGLALQPKDARRAGRKAVTDPGHREPRGRGNRLQAGRLRFLRHARGRLGLGPDRTEPRQRPAELRRRPREGRVRRRWHAILLRTAEQGADP
jgi:dihydrofolate reductase